MKPALWAAIAAITLAAAPAMAEENDCEQALATLRATMQTATPSAADAAKIKELEAKGVERCNADDDEHANEFFNKAMKILGKQN